MGNDYRIALTRLYFRRQINDLQLYKRYPNGTIYGCYISQFYYLFLKSIYKSFSKNEGMDSFNIIIIEGIYFCALETK